jgi:hypothetical protein
MTSTVDGGSSPPQPAKGAPEPHLEALVTVTESEGRDTLEAELPVHSLRELYDTCRGVAAGTLVRVHLRGEDGEVRLNFASLIRPGDPAQEERA